MQVCKARPNYETFFKKKINKAGKRVIYPKHLKKNYELPVSVDNVLFVQPRIRLTWQLENRGGSFIIFIKKLIFNLFLTTNT